MTHKRKNYLEWQEYFMSIAFLSAQRSKDPSTQVGACIVNRENKVVGIGYNGMPIGCSDDAMPWNKAADASQEKWLRSKLPYVCHAELNAVMNKNCADVKDCVIYVALFPCNMCAQIIIQSGITEVVYFCDNDSEKSETKAAKYLLDMAGINCRQFTPKQSTVEIIFSRIEETAGAVPTLPSRHQLTNGHLKEEPSLPLRDLTNNTETQIKKCVPKIVNSSCQLRKRPNYLEWEEYFMAMAFLSAQRSKDPRTQVGACIVNKEKKIVGIGYNGMPIGCSDDVMPWNRAGDSSETSWLDSKSPYVCHAELNAVLNKNTADVKECIIYVALFPCNKCAQVVIQSGIREVVYYSDKYHDQPDFKASRHLLSTAGVKYRQFRPHQERILIDFCLNNVKEQDILTLDGEKNKSSVEKDSNGNALIGDRVAFRSNNEYPTKLHGTKNNNNVGNTCKYSDSCLDNGVDSLGNVDQGIPNNFVVNDPTVLVSQESEWFNEVQELRFAFLSLLIAGIVVVFTWYAGKLDLSESNYF